MARGSRSAAPRYLDAELDLADRVDDLLARLSIEQKIQQLVGCSLTALAPEGRLDVDVAQPLLAGGMGHIARTDAQAALKPQASAELINAIQRRLVEETEHGIPALVCEAGAVGSCVVGTTLFPQPIAQAASFEPRLIRRLAAVVAQQMHATGARQALAPVLDIAGGTGGSALVGGFGEDPYLCGRMGIASIRGLQGERIDQGVAATGMHFLGGGETLQIGARELREVHAEPFSAAIREARPAVLMAANNHVDGAPCTSAPALLRELLRDELKFEGVVFVGPEGVADLVDAHATAGTGAEAAAQALRAGVDVELSDSPCFSADLAEAVAADSELAPLLDEAVARVLRLKFELGLFESPFVTATDAGTVFGTDEQRGLAEQVAQASMVLLENDGVLPLQGMPAMALLGPAADDARALFGDDRFPANAAPPTLKDALSQQYSVNYAQGCEYLPSEQNELSAIKEAVALARGADLVVLCVRGAGSSLSGNQEALIDRVLAIGKPVILALFGTHNHDLGRFAGRVSALLQCWSPGEAGAAALLTILDGSVSPSGRLPLTVRGADGQLQYPFGYGLSYAAFAYGTIEAPAAVDVFGVIVLSVSVENTGNCAAADVVQLYLRDLQADVTRPAQTLVGFSRVELAPGQRKRVQFQLDASQAAYFNQALDYVVEPGEILLSVGSSRTALHQQCTVQLEGELRQLQQHQVISTRVAVSALQDD